MPEPKRSRRWRLKLTRGGACRPSPGLGHCLPWPSKLLPRQWRVFGAVATLPPGSASFHVSSLRVAKSASGAFPRQDRSEEHTSELQSLMRISYPVFCLNKKKITSLKHYSTYVSCLQQTQL